MTNSVDPGSTLFAKLEIVVFSRIRVKCSLFPEDFPSEFNKSLLQLLMSCVAAVKSLSVHHKCYLVLCQYKAHSETDSN